MNRTKSIFVLIFIPLVLLSQEKAASDSSVGFSELFFEIDQNILGGFTRDYGLNHLLAIGSTYSIVIGGLDWKWYRYSSDHPVISNAGFTSVGIGGLVPFAVPLGLYILGRSDRDRDLQITGLALGQAAMISWSISSFYKALAARKPPEHEGERTTNSDYSKDFRFGLFNRGVFNGWPSGHSMTAFAMAITLVELYPDHETLRYLSWTYAIVVAAGVSTNIHWLSDATSGALMGYSIGKTVGSSFKRLRGQHKSNDGFSLLVIPDGLLLQYRF